MLSNKLNIASSMQIQGLVPVFYHADFEISKRVIEACYKGGLRVFEFTDRGSHAFETFSKLSQYVKEALPDMFLGAGSITEGSNASSFIQAGARFIVSPAFIPLMAEICKKKDILWIPGCGTVTEIVLASNLGATIIKVFPAMQVGGWDFIKAVRGPLPEVMLMPTGGVTSEEENLKSWFKAGVCCVGIGSDLFHDEWIRAGNFEKITAMVSNTLRIINQLKENSGNL